MENHPNPHSGDAEHLYKYSVTKQTNKKKIARIKRCVLQVAPLELLLSENNVPKNVSRSEYISVTVYTALLVIHFLVSCMSELEGKDSEGSAEPSPCDVSFPVGLLYPD